MLVGLPLGYSFYLLFLKFVRGEKENLVPRLFDCFKDYGKSFGISFMVFLYTPPMVIVTHRSWYHQKLVL